MNQAKGYSLKIIKKMIDDSQVDFEKDYLPRLTPEGREQFKKLAISWIPIPAEAKGSVVYEAAKLLCPGPDSISLAKFGELQAQVLPGFYQFILSIPAKDYILKKFNMLWKSFYDTGQLVTEMTGDKSAKLILRDYPDYPIYCQQFMNGWLKGFGRHIKLNLISVICDNSDPQAITWDIKWS